MSSRSVALEPPQPCPQSGEQHIISTLLASPSASRDQVRIPAGDDGAVLPNGECWALDTMVEGVHFDERCSAEDVGFKLVAVNVSDLAAMGARPRWLLLSVSLPTPLDTRWLRGFAAGVHAACLRWGLALIGGDTTRSPGPRLLSATIGGQLVAAPLKRAGARIGDALVVIGSLGAAGAGWRLPAPPAEALAAWLRPSPPLELGLAIARSGLANAAMDLSDGLAADLPKLCAASGVGAEVARDQLPIAPCLANLEGARDHALFGGEDYTLLLAAPRRALRPLRALAAAYAQHISVIGHCTAARTLQLDAGPWPLGGFAHFEGAS